MFIDELIFQGRLLMIDECGLVLLLLKLILLLFYVVLIMHARITHSENKIQQWKFPVGNNFNCSDSLWGCNQETWR